MKYVKMFEDINGWETTFSSQFEGHEEELHNYMFFQHLMTIKDAIDHLLTMDRKTIDKILADGHGWANDHITTSVDDIEEVYHFLKNRMADHFETEGGEEKEHSFEPAQIEIIGNNDEVEVEDEEGKEEE
jgi:hypothetical protein